MNVKYPDIDVPLIGEDGNAFAIIGRVAAALADAGVDDAEINAFRADAMSSDYNHLLRVVMNTVSVTVSASLGPVSDDDAARGDWL